MFFRRLRLCVAARLAYRVSYRQLSEDVFVELLILARIERFVEFFVFTSLGLYHCSSLFIA